VIEIGTWKIIVGQAEPAGPLATNFGQDERRHD
jgi:hypothetical protein